jgi:hypothetical protein
MKGRIDEGSRDEREENMPYTNEFIRIGFNDINN